MKTAGASLIAFLDAAPGATIRHLVTLTTRGGTVARWTDHHSDITYSGNTYRRGGEGTTYPIPLVGASELRAGLDITKCDLTLACGTTAALSGTFLPTAALAGTLDGAWIKIERLFGSGDIDTTLGVLHHFEGVVGEVTPGDHSVSLEVESGQALLRKPIPHTTYQPGCTARLYDSQCALVANDFTVGGTVLSGCTTTSIVTGRSEVTGTTNSLGRFALGVMTIAGESRGVRSYTGTGTVGTFVLDQALSAAPAAGTAYSVYPGCPKTLAACSNNTAAAGPQFNNATHFRGFPFVPKYELGG